LSSQQLQWELSLGRQLQAATILCAGLLGELESGALASGWDHLFNLVSILLLGAFSLSLLLIAARILFSFKVKVLGGWLRPVVG
jgi:hypothetical protein